MSELLLHYMFKFCLNVKNNSFNMTIVRVRAIKPRRIKLSIIETFFCNNHSWTNLLNIVEKPYIQRWIYIRIEIVNSGLICGVVEMISMDAPHYFMNTTLVSKQNLLRIMLQNISSYKQLASCANNWNSPAFSRWF